MIRLGLLGCSKIATRLMPTLLNLDLIRIRGAASSEIQRTSEFCKKFNLNLFESYASCVSSTEIDAVYISVLNADHYQLTKLALENGKHVLCEKPMVLKHYEAVELFNLASTKKLILLEGFMYRFHPQVQRVLEIVRSGGLGKIHSISCDFSFILETHNTNRRTKEAGGGAVADLGCYCIDFINTLLQPRQIPEIHAFHLFESKNANSVETRSSIILKFEDNPKLVTINCAIDSPSLNIWEVRCEKGSVGITRFDPQGSSPSQILIIDENSVPLIEKLPSVFNGNDQFKMEFTNFANCILGKEAPFITPEDSIWNSMILEKLRKTIKFK